MSQQKQKLVSDLRECAQLMAINGENPFRCRAYEQGARTLEGLTGEPGQWIQEGTLEQTPGVGERLRQKIQEWVDTGTFEQLKQLRQQVPAGLLGMMDIPGLGPRKARQIWREKGIETIDQLESAARAGTLHDLAGFGERSVQKILAGIRQRQQYAERHRLDEAAEAIETVESRLRPLPEIGRLELAGSCRRACETVKDLDYVATSDNPKHVMKVFVESPGVQNVIAHGATKSSVLLGNGLQVDLRVVESEEFPTALNYFTGSKSHNTRLRGRARQRGWKLNEYGLFEQPEGKDGVGKRIQVDSEHQIYDKLGLQYIPPELREDQGEIEAAEQGRLPELIGQVHMAGVIHCHSNYSDGRTTILQMAEPCREAGYHYLVICDHSQSAQYAGGLKPGDVERQMEEIDRVNQQIKGFRIFKGIESDIGPEGELDYDDVLLETLDLVIASIHSRMSMDAETMTRRICRALEHPATTILGHPTGRLLLQREPYHLDLEQVIRAAAEHDVILEINANPHRLDLDWRYMRMAREVGCRFAINPDAHATDGIADIRFGVGVARKGGLTPDTVINTMPAQAFANWLAQRKRRRFVAAG